MPATVLLYLLAAAVVRFGAATPAGGELPHLLVKPDDPALTFSGRSIVYANGSRSFDWSSQTIMVTITNTTNISMLMNESKCSNRYAVYNFSTPADGPADYGARVALVRTNSSTNRSDFMPFTSNQRASSRYPLATKLARAAATNLLIYKTTEPNGIWMPFGPALFQGLLLDAGAVVETAPAPWLPDRRLEIFGDSITACFGCTGSARYDPACDGIAAEDAWFSWGAVLGRNLRAEYHLQAWSAIGLLHDATPFSPGVMEAMVGRTLGGRCGDTPQAGVACGDTPANAWPVSRFPPSAVVINLGVNDGLALPPLRTSANASQWAVAVASVAAHYAKGTPIVLTVGPWLPAWPNITGCGVLCNFSLAAVSYGRRLGYNVSYHRYTAGSVEKNNTSCGGHPEADAQQAMGDQLTPVLKEMLGW
jgi:hypothetical protein